MLQHLENFVAEKICILKTAAMIKEYVEAVYCHPADLT